MKELAKSILIYVVIVTALKGMITNPKYGQYFQFFSGIIMILLMMSPVLSVLDSEGRWYALFEENILQMDVEGIREEMRVADERFLEIVKQEYEETMARQVEAMAEENGLSAERAEVKLRQRDGEWEVGEIDVVTGETAGGGQEISIETVRVGERALEEEDTSADAIALRRRICSYFVIGEDRVHIWK